MCDIKYYHWFWTLLIYFTELEWFKYFWSQKLPNILWNWENTPPRGHPYNVAFSQFFTRKATLNSHHALENYFILIISFMNIHWGKLHILWNSFSLEHLFSRSGVKVKGQNTAQFLMKMTFNCRHFPQRPHTSTKLFMNIWPSMP